MASLHAHVWQAGMHARTREVPSEEYCTLLTDLWLASLADYLVTEGKILAWTYEFAMH